MNRKKIAILLAVSLIFPILSVYGTVSVKAAASATDSPYYNEPGTLPIVKEKITLKVVVPETATVEDFATNEMTLALEEDTNIHLEFIGYPSGEFRNRLNLLFASGDAMPDIFMETSFGGQANIGTWGQAGKLLPLNDYMDEYSYWLPQIFETCATSYEDAIRYATSSDGNLYGLFNLTESYNNMVNPGRIMYYEPWVQRLRAEAPTSTEELFDLLVQFRDSDMNGNGIKDEIPLASSTNNLFYLRYSLLTPFTYIQPNYWQIEDGEIGVAFTTDGWREGLRYIKSLVDENLLDRLSFTQDEAQLNALLAEEPPRVGMFTRISASNMSSSDPKRYEYNYIYALSAPGGERINTLIPAAINLGYLISSTTKYPEAAFMLGDYMAGEKFSMIGRYGTKGVHWEDPGPGDFTPYRDFDIKPLFTIIENIWSQPQNAHWQGIGARIASRDASFGASMTLGREFDTASDQARAVFEAHSFTDPDRMVANLVYTDEELNVINDIYKPIMTYVDECFSRFILGDLSIENDWDSYIKTIEGMGLKDGIAATQKCYDRMNSK